MCNTPIPAKRGLVVFFPAFAVKTHFLPFCTTRIACKQVFLSVFFSLFDAHFTRIQNTESRKLHGKARFTGYHKKILQEEQHLLFEFFLLLEFKLGR